PLRARGQRHLGGGPRGGVDHQGHGLGTSPSTGRGERQAGRQGPGSVLGTGGGDRSGRPGTVRGLKTTVRWWVPGRWRSITAPLAPVVVDDAGVHEGGPLDTLLLTAVHREHLGRGQQGVVEETQLGGVLRQPQFGGGPFGGQVETPVAERRYVHV